MSAEFPILPYGSEHPTSGWSGSDTSRERAEEADADGTTTRRQRQTLAALDAAGPRGLTWRELGAAQGWHHGQASGSLSNLHKVGRIARLTLRRNRCLVYVLPEYIEDRETSPFGRKTPTEDPEPDERIAVLVDLLTRLAGRRCPFKHDPSEPDCPYCQAINYLSEFS